MDSTRAYRPSGVPGLWTLPLFALAAAAAVPLAWMYQALTHWIPFLYLNVLTAVGFGLAIGAMCIVAVRKGPCRNRGVALLLAVPSALVGVLASYWFGYVRFAAQVAKVRPDVQLRLAHFIDYRLQTGWSLSNHSSNGIPITGWGVGLVWLAEAALIVWLAASLARSAASEPYCERCSIWTVPRKLVVRGLSRTDAEQRLADPSALVTLQPGTGPTLLRYTANVCPGCRDRGWLTVEEVQIVRKGRKTEEKKHPVVQNLTLETSTLHALIGRIDASSAKAA